jgi:hypothetical protein
MGVFPLVRLTGRQPRVSDWTSDCFLNSAHFWHTIGRRTFNSRGLRGLDRKSRNLPVPENLKGLYGERGK